MQESGANPSRLYFMILLIWSLSLTISLSAIYLAYFLLMRRYCKRGVNWKSEKLDTAVSVIVATYNEETTLPAKLKNLLEQDYPREQLELVVIDSGSTDGTPRIVRDFVEQNPTIKVVFIQEKERLGKSHALNIAYPKASGNIKIISDADALLEHSAITKIVSNFSDPDVGAACGRQVLLNAGQNPSTDLEKSYLSVYEVLREGESILDSTPIFDGELSAYRASLIESLPENKSADDTRLANIIRRKGYRSVCDRNAVFYAYAPPNSRARIVQKVRRGQGLIRVFWDFKSCMFKKESGKYGNLILPVEFLMHSVFPTLWLILLVAIVVGLALFSPPLFIICSVLLACFAILGRSNNRFPAKIRTAWSFILNFFSSQFLLIYALILWVSGRSLHKWQKVEDTRREWKAE
jgi:cellulose synthase/poly-beta-1,6-N-acetylglucosamine synthase-like glycosyltransferase